MITLYSIITILFCHWLFDFFFQTDKMAQGKSKNNSDLFDHVWVYTIGLCLCAALNEKFLGNYAWIHWIAINSVAHFFTDYVTSRANSGLWEKKQVHDFFVSVGADQLIHYITLFGTFVWLAH